MLPGLELTPEQTTDLLDGLQVLIGFAAIGVAVLVGVLLALLLSMFKR